MQVFEPDRTRACRHPSMGPVRGEENAHRVECGLEISGVWNWTISGLQVQQPVEPRIERGDRVANRMYEVPTRKILDEVLCHEIVRVVLRIDHQRPRGLPTPPDRDGIGDMQELKEPSACVEPCCGPVSIDREERVDCRVIVGRGDREIAVEIRRGYRGIALEKWAMGERG